MTKRISKTAQAVMKKIKKGELKMKPRAYFVLGSMLVGAGVVGVLMLTVLLSGMVWFRLRMQGAVGFLRFGQPGWRFFIMVFPWKVVGLTLVGLVGGSWLLKKYGKGYKVGISWLVLGAVMTVMGLGFLLDRVGVNERLRKVEPVKPFFQIKFKSDDWLVGEIGEISDGKIEIVTPEGEKVLVELDEEVILPPVEFKVGDKVRVIGELVEGRFEAKGLMPGGLKWDSPPPSFEGQIGPGMRPGMMKMK